MRGDAYDQPEGLAPVHWTGNHAEGVAAVHWTGNSAKSIALYSS